jgi:hypothetical protein
MPPDEEIGFWVRVKGKLQASRDLKDVAKATDQLTDAEKRQARAASTAATAEAKRNRARQRRSRGLAAGVGGLIDIALVKNAAQSTIDYADSAAVLANNFGLAFGNAQELTAAIGAYGIETNQFQQGLTVLVGTQQKALSGDLAALDLFNQIGLSAPDIKATEGDVAKLFDTILVGLEGMKDPAQRAVVARQLFGRSWQGIGQILEEGTDEFQRVREQARKLGISLGSDLVGDANRAEEAQRNLHIATMGWNIFLAQSLLPTVTRLTNWAVAHPDIIKNIVAGYVAFSLATKVLYFNTLLMNAAFAASPMGRAIQIASLLAVGIAVLAVRFKSVREAAVNSWNWIKGVWEAAPGFFAMLGKAYVNAWIWPFNKAIDFINGVLHFEINLPDKIPGLPDKFTFDTPDIPRIPTLGGGGTAVSRGLAIVGEHGPELRMLTPGERILPQSAIVQPLAPAMAASGGSTVVELYLDGKKVAEAVASAENNRRARS